MDGSASGWVLLIGAGAANATFSLPMKFVRRWQWENTWAVWTLLALVVLPSACAFAFVPSLGAIYSGSAPHAAAVVCLLGAGWGLAQVLFGRAIDAIGIGLAFSIVLGISTAGGTLLPLLHLQQANSPSHLLPGIFIGLAFIALGVTACAIAGHRRETAQAVAAEHGHAFTPGLMMALASGILASFMNVGLAFAEPILSRATAEGIAATRGMFAVWLPLLLGGAVPNLLYCIYLLRQRGTLRLYRDGSQARNAFLAASMAVLWFFSTVLYGVATQWLGSWGVVLGWPVFMSVIVIAAGLLGIASGEWAHSGKAPILFQVTGILLLVLAIIAISRAQNALQQSQLANPPGQTANLQIHVR